MSSSPRVPVTDSPWFFVLIFSLMALVVLLAIGHKYEGRQAGIERQYQARERVAEKVAAENNSPVASRIDGPEARRDYATPAKNLIPLWPLAALLALVAATAALMLVRARWKVPVSGQSNNITTS